MDNNEVVKELVRQVVEGDRYQVELVKDKIKVLRDEMPAPVSQERD